MLSIHRRGLHACEDEGEDLVRASCGMARYPKLVELKRRHDRENVFRLKHNIPS